MPIGIDTFAYARDLLHLRKAGKTYFLTFVTHGRWTLPPAARDLTLKACTVSHEEAYWLHAAVVMPDHVHLLMTAFDEYDLARIVHRIKGISAHGINKLLARTGAVWQREYFDRIVRSDEDLLRKGEYLLANPVRKGLVTNPLDYPWTWRA